jgi:putative NIF3 family GTP cyclohydrolase 1 type 2
MVKAKSGAAGGNSRKIKNKYMKVERNKIVKFCEEYLKVKNFTDYCYNGLQVEGAEKIDKIVIGVSFSEELIKAAVKAKAQILIVHHGLFGDLKKQMSFSEFAKSVEKKLNTKIYAIAAGPKMVKKIGIVSGGASPDFKLAKELGADVYLCGDIREEVVEAVKESQINFINAGHYNTEKLGIINPGRLLEKNLK